jgi:hypothetical protein
MWEIFLFTIRVCSHRKIQQGCNVLENLDAAALGIARKHGRIREKTPKIAEEGRLWKKTDGNRKTEGFPALKEICVAI